MAIPQTLRTSRLQLEPYAEQHLGPRHVSWLNDPEVVRFSENRFRTHTLASCRAYWQSFEGTPNLLWAIQAQKPALGHIGNASASVDERHGTADVGILIGEREAWGQGLGHEAWLAICDHLLRVVGLRKVSGGALATNAAMLRVMQKAGMREDGRRVAQCLWDGRPVDVVHFASFREAWLAEHPPGSCSSDG